MCVLFISWTCKIDWGFQKISMFFDFLEFWCVVVQYSGILLYMQESYGHSIPLPIEHLICANSHDFGMISFRINIFTSTVNYKLRVQVKGKRIQTCAFYFTLYIEINNKYTSLTFSTYFCWLVRPFYFRFITFCRTINPFDNFLSTKYRKKEREE